MTPDPIGAHDTLVAARSLGVISEEECGQVMSVFKPAFPFAVAVAAAESLHVHIKVNDVAPLPHRQIRDSGGRAVNETDGYVKYAFPCGLNLIFSSIDVAEEDLLDGESTATFPVMDHIGLDLRTESARVREVFDAVPVLAGQHHWRHVAQGGLGTPVYCCHTEVTGKHWVYPPAGAPLARPIEVAFGQLEVHGTKMGCDLRPIDPVHPRAAEASAALSACAASHTHLIPGQSRPAPRARATTNAVTWVILPTWATTPSR